MKIKLIAIAAIALAPAVVLGQATTHIPVTKDGTHSPTTQQTTNGDVYTAPTPAPTPDTTAAPAPTPDTTAAPAPTPPADTTAAKTDSSQLGTGATAPTPTHSQQTDSTMSTDSTMRMDSTSATSPTDTVRVERNPLRVAPVDSARIGIPATPETQRADSMRADSARRATDTTAAPPPR